MKRIVLTIFVVLFIPALVSAQNLFDNWYTYLNVPTEFATFPNVLYFVFIPFLGTFTIIWGILTNLNIFRLNKVNIILSFLFALALLYSTILTTITFYLFNIGGVFGVIAFFILFFVGTILYSRGIIYGWRGFYGSFDRAISEQKKLKDVYRGRLNENRIQYYDAFHQRGRYRGVGLTAAQAAMLRLEMQASELRKMIASCDAEIAGFKHDRKYSKKVLKRIKET
jgi:hypothetical protein